MPQVVSRDGTSIAYEVTGAGEHVVLIDGALGSRSLGQMPRLAALLAPQFGVVTYDRRGRGESGDTQPYAVGREVEDIGALIDEVGGAARLYGISSGAALALEAAAGLGEKVEQLAMYEPPYNAAADAVGEWQDYRRRLTELLAAGRRGDAAGLFMAFVGVPAAQIDGMRSAPMWSGFEAVAPTLAYDAAILGDVRSVPAARAACVAAPSLIMNGGASLPFMRETALALAEALPDGHYRELEGQPHDVSLEVLAPVLIEFFRSDRRQRQEAGGGQERSKARPAA